MASGNLSQEGLRKRDPGTLADKKECLPNPVIIGNTMRPILQRDVGTQEEEPRDTGGKKTQN